MLRVAQPLHENGYILMTTLVVLFVLMLLITASTTSEVLNQKMQNNWVAYQSVFTEAEQGLMARIFQHEGKAFVIPASSITLKTNDQLISVDACGNQTMDLFSTAQNTFSTVTLNSRVIFARVPTLQNCMAVPLHQIMWWRKMEDDS